MPAPSIAKSKGLLMLESLQKGLDNHRDCHWPGKPEFVFALVPLSCTELQEANAGAEARFRELGTELGLFTADDFGSELHTQVLAMAIRDPNDHGKRLFAEAAELRDNLTPDERTLLTDEFIELQDQTNPMPEEMAPETFDAIDLLLKKKAESQLRSLGSRMLTRFLLSMERQQSGSPIGN
jgi:hypothetical protein